MREIKITQPHPLDRKRNATEVITRRLQRRTWGRP